MAMNRSPIEISAVVIIVQTHDVVDRLFTFKPGISLPSVNENRVSPAEIP